VVKAGPSAAWFWFCGICYCREHLTDGFIQDEMLPTLAPGVSNPKKLAAQLVATGLWHDADGGYHVHDFLDWNPARATVLEQRKRDAERKKVKPESVSESSMESTSESIRESGGNPNGFQREPSRDRAGVAGSGSGSSFLGKGSGKGFHPPSLVRPRNLHAFWEGPVFDIPEAWARKLITAGNGSVSEADLRSFGQDVSNAMEAAREGVDTTLHLFAWLDGKWRAWRRERGRLTADADHDADYAESQARRLALDAELKSLGKA
jgi:hypothetical protein